ncbi:uncharacterized protein EV154DRAFT_517115 [Mucor mucedo]|uniref:uncharacterized protein n=1 Tax=Mucor mucedo TaxID=29922 RepID=UPI002220C81E|nr:uncharacterized protein EV154DRAFT_517115 [Mucor mucedo]KAI7888579.1 hypothetical protein EV154DRAFT_517115 [Mucor mucedo]
MTCQGCNKPHKQVELRSSTIKDMPKGQVQEAIGQLKYKPLKEIQKHIRSDTCYLHFSTKEGASYFYNSYHEKGLSLNNIHFTVHPTRSRDGTVVTYPAAAPTTTPTTTPAATPATASTRSVSDNTPVNKEWAGKTREAIERLSKEIKRLSSSIWHELWRKKIRRLGGTPDRRAYSCSSIFAFYKLLKNTTDVFFFGMVCPGCNKPQKQVKLTSPSLKNMTKGQAQDAVSGIRFKLLNEVQKHVRSDTCYLHFTTIEGASYFYNIYHQKGIKLNNF